MDRIFQWSVMASIQMQFQLEICPDWEEFHWQMGGFCLFRPFSDEVVYDTSTPLFFFFLSFNGENFSLPFTKLLKYLSHILLKFNEIRYYFLPCLPILLVPHTTMLIVSVLYYTQLAIHFAQKLFSVQKARNERWSSVSRLFILRRWQTVQKVFRKWMVE